MRSPTLTVLAAAAVLCAGCRTTSIREVSSNPTPRVRVGTHKRTWEVRSGERALGLVVLFTESGRDRDSLYIVRNPWHQDLGVIDGLGRAYRYLPHREEPVWVGSGTIAAGAQCIVCSPAESELIEKHEPLLGPLPGSTPDGARPLREAAPELPARGSDSSASDGGLPQSR